MARKKLVFGGNPNAKKAAPTAGETGLEGQMADAVVGQTKTKNQLKKEQKEREIAKKKAEKAAAKAAAA